MQNASDYPTKSLEGLKRGRGEAKVQRSRFGCNGGSKHLAEAVAVRGPRLTVSVLPE